MAMQILLPSAVQCKPAQLLGRFGFVLITAPHLPPWRAHTLTAPLRSPVVNRCAASFHVTATTASAAHQPSSRFGRTGVPLRRLVHGEDAGGRKAPGLVARLFALELEHLEAALIGAHGEEAAGQRPCHCMDRRLLPNLLGEEDEHDRTLAALRACVARRAFGSVTKFKGRL